MGLFTKSVKMFECRDGNTVLHHREPSSPLHRGKGKEEAKLEATALSRGVAMGMRRKKHKRWHTRRKITAISSSNVLWIYSNFQDASSSYMTFYTPHTNLYVPFQQM